MVQDTRGDATHGDDDGELRGYPFSEELLQDLRGARGGEARGVARGYLMAIQDAEADQLSAATLLKYLRGDAGPDMRLAGLGYVLAVRDWMTPALAPGLPAAAVDVAARMRRDANHVRAWLERRSESLVQSAVAMAQVALSSEAEAARAPAMAGASWSRLRAWLSRRSALSDMLVGAALALVAVVAVRGVDAPAHGTLATSSAAHDLQVSREAENITTMMLEQRRFEKDSIINVTDREEVDAYAGKWSQARVALSKNIDDLDRLDLDALDRQELLDIKRDFDEYEQGYLQLLAQMQSGQVRTSQDANRIFAAYKPAAHRVEVNGTRIASRALNRLQLR